MKKARILFMGTPEFAVPTLRALLGGPDEVVAVITNPDRPAGRGKAPTPPPVKVAALGAGVQVLQPEKIKTDAFWESLVALELDLAVVVAYGRILPQRILDVPRLGCLNVHASVLPELRGAAPIQWAVARGHTRSGVSIMRMEAGLDTGPVFKVVQTEIGPDETAGELHDRLSTLGPPALLEVIEALKAGHAVATEQAHDLSTYAPLMKKEDGDLDWRQRAEELAWRVRGFNPWPGAWTTAVGEPRLEGGPLKVHRARAVPRPEGVTDEDWGTVCDASHGRLVVVCGEGALELLEVQAPGRKAMTAADFLRGLPLARGVRFARTSP
jgi:methionyl-tRNA formyltransferase